MKRQNTKNALPTKVTWIWELFTESLETQENRILGKARSREISGEGEGTIKGLSWWGFHCQRISRNCVDIDFDVFVLFFCFFPFIDLYCFLVSSCFSINTYHINICGIFRKWRKTKLPHMVQIKPASGAEGHSQEMATPGSQAASAGFDTGQMNPFPCPSQESLKKTHGFLLVHPFRFPIV